MIADMQSIRANRIEVHLYYPGRGGQMRKVIAWGDRAVMDRDFAGVSGMCPTRARLSRSSDHLRIFGRRLAEWLRMPETDLPDLLSRIGV